jgi:hypothetical protein
MEGMYASVRTLGAVAPALQSRRVRKFVDHVRALASSLVRLLAGRWTLSVLAELDGGGRCYQDIYNGIKRARNERR